MDTSDCCRYLERSCMCAVADAASCFTVTVPSSQLGSVYKEASDRWTGEQSVCHAPPPCSMAWRWLKLLFFFSFSFFGCFCCWVVFVSLSLVFVFLFLSFCLMILLLLFFPFSAERLFFQGLGRITVQQR